MTGGMAAARIRLTVLFTMWDIDAISSQSLAHVNPPGAGHLSARA
jgi:hypothetical protein